jgi:hypothetical protein
VKGGKKKMSLAAVQAANAVRRIEPLHSRRPLRYRLLYIKEIIYFMLASQKLPGNVC